MPAATTSSAALLQNLTALLERHGLSQAEFARRSGVPATTLNRVINDLEGGLSPRLDTVEAIAQGFGLTVGDLLSGAVPEGGTPADPPHNLARQLSRLVEDFVVCDAAGRIAVLRAAEENAARSGANTAASGG